MVAAEMMPGAMALRQSAATRPGHKPSPCQIGQTINGTTTRFASASTTARPGRRRSASTRAQSMRASASISSKTASGHSRTRVAEATFWKASPIASDKGRRVVARPPMRRKT